jgi:predicted RNA-binding Zn ribbon-like protein
LLADPARLADLRDNTSSDVKHFCGFLIDQELRDKRSVWCDVGDAITSCGNPWARRIYHRHQDQL